MWQRTQGNALFLTEIVRHARRNGDIHDEGGVWVWTADEQVPARLVDLLEQRFDGLGPSGRDAVGALVLGEPLSLDSLVVLASEDGIAEAEGTTWSGRPSATASSSTASPIPCSRRSPAVA